MPKNATFMSHDFQNEVIKLMARCVTVTEKIVKDVGDGWFTIKVNRAKDLTGRENIFIIIR